MIKLWTIQEYLTKYGYRGLSSLKDALLIDKNNLNQYKIHPKCINSYIELYKPRNERNLVCKIQRFYGYQVGTDPEKDGVDWIYRNDFFVVDEKTPKRIDTKFSSYLESWKKANEKDSNNFNSLGWGYGTRAYHKFKTTVCHADRVREKMRIFLKKYTPSDSLLTHSKQLKINI